MRRITRFLIRLVNDRRIRSSAVALQSDRDRSQDSARRARAARICAVLATLVVAVVASLYAADRFVDVSPTVRLFVKETGTGPAVVVLHGGPGLDFNYLVDDFEPLSRSHRLIFYDQRGGGRSTLSTDVTADQHVADLESVRRRLGLRRLTLLGHSWGGGLAALYAMAHPGRVERMILADSIPARRRGLAGYGDSLQSRLSEEDRVKYREAAEARRQAKTPAEHVAACRAYWGVFAKAYFSDPVAAARDKGDLCAVPGEAIANGLAANASVMAGLGDYDWRAAAKRFTMPVLVIHGEDDPIRLENAREWAETIPHARLVVLAHAGHMSYVDAADQFFEAVEAFLTESRWPGPP
jgi:proline iminopeptidase